MMQHELHDSIKNGMVWLFEHMPFTSIEGRLLGRREDTGLNNETPKL
jgi:hypothetical protein